MRRTTITLIGVLISAASVTSAATVSFQQTNLVSDGTVSAVTTDANLKNPWGLVQGPATPFWVNNQATNTSTLYDANGTPQPAGTPLIVTVPQVRAAPAGPTGIEFNSTSDFVVTKDAASAPAAFLFVGLDGSISGWNPTVDPTNAITAIDDSARSLFTGMTLTNAGAQNRLYIANGQASTIDVKGPDFQPVTTAGNFTDPATPQGLVPFNVRELGGKIFVTYAIPGPTAREEAEGSGSVSVFDTEGNLLQHLIDGGHLASPWGLALAPDSFGDFGGALLVGNFNTEGHINAFNPDTGEFLGFVADANGDAISNENLWSLKFGTGGAGASPDTLFFTAGLNDETGGLFGKIDAVEGGGGGGGAIPLPVFTWAAIPVVALVSAKAKKLLA
jgi:uncharacterized protein (TIGR03118 family)